MDRLLEERRSQRHSAPFLSEKKRFVKSREAYHQSQLKLDLGRELPFLTMRQDNAEHVELLTSTELKQIFDGAKLKFVVSLDSSSTGECSGVTVFERPLCYDDNQCSYYLLRCTLRPNSNSQCQRLVQVVYLLADFCCAEASDPRVTALLERSLATVQPCWNKFNSLLVHAFDEEASYGYGYGEMTTAYDTRSIPFGATGEDHFSEFSNSQVKVGMKQMQSTRSTNQRTSQYNDPFRNFAKHFTKVVRMIEPFTSLFRTASHCKQYLMKGVNFSEETISGLVSWINKSQSLDVNSIQSELLKKNMTAATTACKNSYNEVVRTMFLEGRSIPIQDLTHFLGQVYEQVINSFDHEFDGYSHVEQYEIFRSMVKRFMEKKEAEINELNDYIRENECFEALQSSVDRSRIAEFFNQRFVDSEGEQSNSLSIDALKTFLRQQYMLHVHRDIEAMRTKNEKAVMHSLNYSQNPVEMLRYLEQRVEHCRQKKKRLQDCLKIAERQLDISQNVHNGYELELAQQKLMLQSIQRRDTARLPA